MKKYIKIINTSWQRAMVYRFSVYAYRVGEIMYVLSLVIMWSIIYSQNEVIKGYTFNEMITYVLIGSLIDVIVRNWLYQVVADDIKNGLLSNFLTKPITYLSYILAREVGRISFALFMSALTQLSMILIFVNKIIFNNDMRYLALIMAIITLSFFIELLISFLMGLVAFWTDEISGVHYTVDKIKTFLSGGFFPLALLPEFYVKLSLFFPFAYSYFMPTQLYLKKINLAAGIKGIGIQILWIIALYAIIKIVWKRGLKKYGAVGI